MTLGLVIFSHRYSFGQERENFLEEVALEGNHSFGAGIETLGDFSEVLFEYRNNVVGPPANPLTSYEFCMGRFCKWPLFSDDSAKQLHARLF